MEITKYKFDPKKGFVTGSGRAINPSYRVGLSRSGKTVVVYNKQNRVVGRVSNAKASGFAPLLKPSKNAGTPSPKMTNSYGDGYNEDGSFGKGDIYFNGVRGQTWSEFQENYVLVYGYEYH